MPRAWLQFRSKLPYDTGTSEASVSVNNPKYSNPLNKHRHLNQSQRTLDGNHQCNQFSKNTDPDDVSLCAGKAYFPLDSEYQQYLKSVPTSTAVCIFFC
jgi:hypothetical protein